MIQVNLLPGRESSAGSAAGLGAAGAAFRSGVGRLARDRYLIGSTAAVLLSAGGGATLYTRQAEAEAEAVAREAVAVADSTRYSALLAARRAAAAERDSVRRQLAVITQIDSARYMWAHVLDEMSRSMPPYTWLTAVQQTSAPPTPGGPADSAAAKTPGKPPVPADRKGADSAEVRRPALAFRVTGQTVDIQALTALMRDLEASPFVQRVTLARSEPVQADGKEVTEFTLDAEYEPAPRALLRTERLAVTVAAAR